MVVRSPYTLFLLFLLFLPLSPAYASVKAVTDRTVLSFNESLTLEIIQTKTRGGKPDLSLLEKNFSILSQSQSEQYNISNGKSSSKRTWSIILMPKKSGEIIIPPLSIGKESTAPIHLVIHKSTKNKIPSNQLSKGKILNNQDIFIEALINPKKEVYVQQKIDLHIRIYFHKQIRLSNMALGSLVINDVIMEQSGEDKQYTKIINKQTYNVIERNYTLFPQKSGNLTIPAIRFEAIQNLSSNGGFGGFFSQRGKPVYEQSNPLNITIKKKPDDYSGKYWLPAENLQVISQHSDLSNIKVGDSITITDKIIAKGVLGSLLPGISWPKLKNVKTYPDKASINSQTDKGNIYGLREEKTAIIPLQSGEYQLPKRKIIWWNTLTDQQEEKTIPGISFFVAETESSALLPAKTGTSANNHPIQELDNLENTLEGLSPESSSIINSNYTGYASTRQNPWFWAWLVTSLILSILLIISLFFAFKNPKSSKQNKSKKASVTHSNQHYLKQIKKSCSTNNKSQTMTLLIQWANHYFNHNESEFTNLSTLSLKIQNTDLVTEIQALDKALYSVHSSDWHGNDLFTALKNYLSNNNKTSRTRNLLPLNPI